MRYTMKGRIRRITKECLRSKETNPMKLFYQIARADFVRIHGPEHHFLDGACILTAYCNAGGGADLRTGLKKLAAQSLAMPGGMCGRWGVCGAVTSVGAALALIDETGPLSEADWGAHMQYTSEAVSAVGATGGPRCCKRDGFFAIRAAVAYINEHYAVTLPVTDIKCAFSKQNEQCIKERCPFYVKN